MTNLTMIAVAAAMLAGIPLFIEVGRRLGTRRHREGASEIPGKGAMSGAVFGLLGLLVAFTFSGAAERFDARRQLIIQETNAIGTAWLRLELLPSETQPALRDQFRRYLDLRIAVYQLLPDLDAAMKELAQANALQGDIWSSAVAATRASGNPAVTNLVMPALNEMIDITTTRTVVAQMHPPRLIYAMLYLLLLITATLIGHDQTSKSERPWLHTLAYSVVMAVAIFVILNLEYPRLGFIGLDAADQGLVDLRNTMN